VAETKKMVDIAVELGCDMLNIWNGQDGYDYPLVADYREERAWLIEGVTEAARYAASKKVRLALEYKPKEPRNHSYIARMADTLLVVNRIGMDNVGVCIDTGHAFVGYENVGESIVLASMFGNKLFHMHFNDNYTMWDDDMIVGSIHLPEYFEMVYWLEKTGYRGWFSMDQYPYREDGYGAIRSSVLFVQRMHAILDRVGMKTVDKLLAKRDPIATSEFIRENLLAK
jgi:xylose isomerase